MHFQIGWIAVFILVALLNLYLIYHYFVIPFKSRKPLKRGVLILIHVALMMLGILYFQKFFFGETQTAFMDGLMYVAGIYLCMLFYSVGFFFIYDMLRIINHFKQFPEKLRKFANKFFYGGLTVFIICALITVLGFYPAQKIIVNDYEAAIAQKSSGMNQLKVAMISDAHTGVTIKEKDLIEIKDTINALEPDIIMLVGDIFDEGTTDELKKKTSEVFSQLKATYGTYFVLGNHDDYTGDTLKQVKHFTDAGHNVLRNEALLVDDQFYIVGRDDRNQTRTPYPQIEATMDKDLPVLVMDHRPEYDEVSVSDKADIQLSGHTHNGQVFPIQTFDLFDIGLNYGLHKRGNCQVLISSGVGNYGIPVRIGNPCEIVNLTITFE